MIFAPDSSAAAHSVFQPSADENAAAIYVTFNRPVAASGAPPNVKNAAAQGSGVSHKITGHSTLTVTKWSPYLESRFQELVAARAEGKADAQTLERLQRFRKMRQRLKNPLSASQILRDFEAEELRKKALDAVKAYAFFVHEDPTG